MRMIFCTLLFIVFVLSTLLVLSQWYEDAFVYGRRVHRWSYHPNKPLGERYTIP